MTDTGRSSLHDARFPGESAAYRAARDQLLEAEIALRRQTEAVAAQAENQRFLTQAVYLTLTANVANAAVQLASLDTQMDDTLRVIDDARQTLEITRRRLQFGEASTADVATAKIALEQAEQLAPPLQKQTDQERDLLAALVGRAPSAAPSDMFDVADFQLPLELPVSLPSDLVRQRPDVRAAEANVHVASALLGVATAARLPSFNVAASMGGASGQLATLFAGPNTLWSVTGGAAQTVFDAGALHHRQKAASAALNQAQFQYQSTVLVALQNTADVLQAIVDDAEGLKHAAGASEATRDSLRLAKTDFQHGQTGVLPLLAAQAADDQARIALTQARANRLIDTVALYQALGGGWRDRAPDSATPAASRLP